MTAVLYSFRRCPYAMRARMALSVSGLTYEHREVALRDKPQAMLDASPKGTVPVFITQDGRVIGESLAIALFALDHNDPHHWLANFDADLVALNDGDFKHHLDRYKYASRYKDDAARGDIDLSHRQAASVILDNLDARLGNHPYLSGNNQSFTDIAIFPFIRQFAAVEPDWFNARFPTLSIWLTRHVESDLFKKIMKKHALWSDAQD
ncbi:glutathione S-transferase [Fretibacter rubidus]|uniref:glutathione S-transferase n=1 Tax=Fretibacter rubidus TaxID=570162 RepID=UPI003529F7E7